MYSIYIVHVFKIGFLVLFWVYFTLSILGVSFYGFRQGPLNHPKQHKFICAWLAIALCAHPNQDISLTPPETVNVLHTAASPLSPTANVRQYTTMTLVSQSIVSVKWRTRCMRHHLAAGSWFDVSYWLPDMVNLTNLAYQNNFSISLWDWSYFSCRSKIKPALYATFLLEIILKILTSTNPTVDFL